jgi:hypothetical protein
MAIKFENVVEGYDMLNSGPEYSSVAYICLETGEVLWRGEDLDGPDELPDDIESDKYIGLPRRNDLDLGTRLVMRFAHEAAPDHADEIRRIFSRRGAYARFKSYLAGIGQLKRWCEYEDAETKKALREWCKAKGLEVED